MELSELVPGEKVGLGGLRPNLEPAGAGGLGLRAEPRRPGEGEAAEEVVVPSLLVSLHSLAVTRVD